MRDGHNPVARAEWPNAPDRGRRVSPGSPRQNGGRLQGWPRFIGRTDGLLENLSDRAPVAAHQQPCGRAQHREIGLAYGVATTHEYTTRAVDDRRIGSGEHRRCNQVAQFLQVAVRSVVQDYEVDGHPASPPVSVGGEKLSERRQSVRRVDSGEYDRPIISGDM